LFRIFSSY
jgi:hypothetical protein